MSFVLLGVLATNCLGKYHSGALLTAPFLYNEYGQNFYVNEFNWWFRGFTFILIFACNGTGLYGILKFKTSICKVTSYISCFVWFFVLILMLLGSRNASIVAMRNNMGKAALEAKAMSCASDSSETSWSGVCYIWGLCILLNFQAAAAYIMITLDFIPIDLDALEAEEAEEANNSTAVSNNHHGEILTSAEGKHSQKLTAVPKSEFEFSSKIVPDESAEGVHRVPLRTKLPDLEPIEDDVPRPHFAPPKPININDLTVKTFKPTHKKTVAWLEGNKGQR